MTNRKKVKKERMKIGRKLKEGRYEEKRGNYRTERRIKRKKKKNTRRKLGWKKK